MPAVTDKHVAQDLKARIRFAQSNLERAALVAEDAMAVGVASDLSRASERLGAIIDSIGRP